MGGVKLFCALDVSTALSNREGFGMATWIAVLGIFMEI